MAFIYLKK